MDKLKSVLFLLLNFILIFAVVAVVLSGLHRIGLFEIPDFAAQLFGIHNGTSGEDSPEGNRSFLTGTGSYTVIKADMTPENVRKVLEAVVPAKRYSHDLQYTVYSSGGKSTKRLVITEDEKMSCAYFISDGAVTRQIVRTDSATTVNTLDGERLNSVSYSNGSFDFAEDTGAIITHKDFFEAVTDDNYTFTLASDDDSSLLIINFTSSNGSYSQLQNYTLNLDYGIVTEAYCYENENLVYSMTTNALSEGTDVGMTVPESFLNFIDAANAPQLSE